MAHRRRDRLTTSRSGTSRTRTCKGHETPPDLQSGAFPFGHGSKHDPYGSRTRHPLVDSQTCNRYTYGSGLPPRLDDPPAARVPGGAVVSGGTEVGDGTWT